MMKQKKTKADYIAYVMRTGYDLCQIKLINTLTGEVEVDFGDPKPAWELNIWLSENFRKKEKKEEEEEDL